jgi:hypothetical protein
VPCCYATDIQLLKEKRVYPPNKIKVDLFLSIWLSNKVFIINFNKYIGS